MDACITFAEQQGAPLIRLVTNDVLDPALGLYRTAGFTEVAYADARYDRGNTQMVLNLPR